MNFVVWPVYISLILLFDFIKQCPKKETTLKDGFIFLWVDRDGLVTEITDTRKQFCSTTSSCSLNFF